jgi:hypothetical protein
MEKIIENFKYFVSTNQVPSENKILISLLVVLCFSISIFMLSWVLFSLRNIDVLSVEKYNLKNGLLWLFGAILLQFILISTKVISYNIFTFLAISMLWDSMYQKLFTQTKYKELLNASSIDKSEL